MPWYEFILFCCFNNVHSSAYIKSKKIRFIIHSWQCFLHNEVFNPRHFERHTTLILCFNSSFSFLNGFTTMVKNMFSKERLLLSISYTGCLIGTLYFAMFAKSTAMTVLFAVAQIITLLWMLLGSIPGGTTGLKFFGQMFKSSVSNTLPV